MMKTSLMKDLTDGQLTVQLPLLWCRCVEDITTAQFHSIESELLFCTGQKQSPEMFCKKDILKNSTKFTRTQLCRSLFFNKVAGLMPATF